MEMNVKECAFYNDKICKSPINKNCKECESIRIEHCYYKQLQQLKEENEELKKLNEELIGRANAYNGMKILANCRLEKLEKIEEICKSRDYVLETTSRLQKDILQIIRGEEC